MPTKSRIAVSLLLAGAAFTATAPQAPLAELVKKPYLELITLAPSLEIPRKSIDDFHKQIETQKKEDLDGLEAEKKQLKSQEDDIHRQLDDLNRALSVDDAAMAKQRRDLHCKLLKIDRDLRGTKTERGISIPADYDNRLTKLDIIAQWPAKKKEIEAAVAGGSARARRFGDIDDIGYRKIGTGQEGDIKLGEDAVNELRAYQMLPPECDSRPLRDYAQELGDRIAAHSDLRIPLRVAVLDTEEINAFGLPGGRLFVDVGLIRRAANEDELAGIVAHEIAHIAARHGERLTRPTGSVTRMLMQGITMAADAFTSGAVGHARTAARDYLGLGVHLNLALLGVSRETEAEAGVLGTQYLWSSGYDARGFMYFYDKMAGDADHAVTASFFRTHPPSIDRALVSLAELEYLPKKAHPRSNSPAFLRAKATADAWLKLHNHHPRAPVECAN